MWRSLATMWDGSNHRKVTLYKGVMDLLSQNKMDQTPSINNPLADWEYISYETHGMSNYNLNWLELYVYPMQYKL